MPCPRLALWLLLGLGAPAAAQVDAPALFASNCAKCHGLDGSGTGPTVLDRPARNFKEGGFSFGNTPAVIARTIAHGIPGSPMPSFEGAFSDEQLRALAEYVVTLGPPVKEVSEAETLLHVTDRPLVVRGILPPIEEGGPITPRGLLIGTTDGLTFEYSADDVRLLAVRQGDFVKRTDWGDRGGSPLEPLGKVIATSERGTGTWSLAGVDEPSLQGTSVEARSLTCRLMATTTATGPTVSYALVGADQHDAPYAFVEEVPGLAKLGDRTGFSRRFVITRLYAHDRVESGALELQLGAWTEALVPAHTVKEPWHSSWWMRTVAPDTGELLHVIDEMLPRVPLELVADATGLRGRVSLVQLPENRGGDFGRGDQDHVRFTLEAFVVSPWTPEVIADLQKAVSR